MLFQLNEQVDSLFITSLSFWILLLQKVY